MVTSFEPRDPDYAKRVRASFARQRVMRFFGAELADVKPGYCEIRLPFKRDLTQQHGYVHGGVIGTIADSSAGYAGYSLMPADASVLTVEYKLNLLAPGEGESLVARGHVIKPGRTLVIAKAEVTAVKDGGETLCATLLQTLMTMNDKPDTATS